MPEGDPPAGWPVPAPESWVPRGAGPYSEEAVLGTREEPPGRLAGSTVAESNIGVAPEDRARSPSAEPAASFAVCAAPSARAESS
ncbi:hypothetical protein ACQPZ2_40060 [Nocardia pseudovaccinii]|uniref:hypothetical protein n=1 Tax=Nocardia pseudovaccinii TaxID=189540 RepID=UPI003D916202